MSSFITTVDNATQTILGGWVESVEDKMLAAGIPVLVRRREQAPFHATIATIHPDYGNSTCPASNAVYFCANSSIYCWNHHCADDPPPPSSPHPLGGAVFNGIHLILILLAGTSNIDPKGTLEALALVNGPSGLNGSFNQQPIPIDSFAWL